MNAIKLGDDVIILDCGVYLPPLVERGEYELEEKKITIKDMRRRGVLPNDLVLDKLGWKDKVRAIIKDSLAEFEIKNFKNALEFIAVAFKTFLSNYEKELEDAYGFSPISFRTSINYSGTDDELVELARKNAFNLSAGHSFIVFMQDMFPVNVLNAIRRVPEVCRIFCATANPVEVIIAETEQGRGILGVVDGFASKGIETEDDIQWRKDLLRQIGYKQ